MRTSYKRILLKLSGESLMGAQGYGIDPVRVNDYAEQIKEVAQAGVEVAIVIGGGNIFRGLAGAAKGVDRVKGDQMGMLATVINSLALCSALETVGQPAQVLTAVNMFPIGEHYSKWKAIEARELQEAMGYDQTSAFLRASGNKKQLQLVGQRKKRIFHRTLHLLVCLVASSELSSLCVDSLGLACFFGKEEERFCIAARNQSFIHLLQFKFVY